MKQFARYLLIGLAVPSLLWAQSTGDDGGFLTRQIEGALSGAGREVKIQGFSGALSSEATFDRMTIADDQGIWLTLEGASLIWSRTALLRGRLQVDSLTAQSLQIERLPDPGEKPAELPAAEAEPFSLQLPELPVSINLAAFEVVEIDLGEPVIGVPAQLNLTAAARLDGEGLFLNMAATHTDEVSGGFVLEADVQRDGTLIDVNLELEEAESGIAANLLKLPGLPSVDLTVAGEGVLDDFTADIALQTDETPRLDGQVILSTEGDADTGPDRRIRANLGGDITALVAPEYQSFFGPDVGLVVDTLLRAEGEIEVQDFDVTAQALELRGEVHLNKDLWPSFVDIAGQIAQDGAPVVLPGSDATLSVEAVALDVDFDQAEGNELIGVFDIQAFDHPQARVARTQLRVDGVLDGSVDAIGSFASGIVLDMTGMELQDDKLKAAVGEAVSASFFVNYVEDEPLTVSDLRLDGEDFNLRGDLAVQDLANGFPTDLTLAVVAEDLSRFAGLAGQDLTGAATLSAEGTVVPLSSMFNLDIGARTQDLALGIAQADAVLAGQTDLTLAAERSTSGTFVRDLSLQNAALEVTADAELRSSGSTVQANARLADIAIVVPDYEGPVTLAAQADQSGEGWQVEATLDAPYDSRAVLSGLATGPDADIGFDLTVPEVAQFVPEIEGALSATGRVRQADTGYRVEAEIDAPYDSRAQIAGLATGPDADLQFNLNVPEVASFVPEISGAVTASGRVWQAENGYQVATDIAAPYDSTARVSGLATGPEASIDFDVSVPEVARFAPGVEGPFAATGRIWQAGTGYEVDADIEAPFDARASVAGLATGPEADLNVDVRIPEVAQVAPQIQGAVEAKARIRQAATGYLVEAIVDAPYDSRAELEGLATGPDVDLNLSVIVPEVSGFAPQIQGALNATARVRQAETGFDVSAEILAPYDSRASVSGLATGPEADLDIALSVPEVANFAPQVRGPLNAEGRVWQADGGYNVDFDAGGPFGGDFTVAGLATGPDARVDFKGRLPDVAVLVPAYSGEVSLSGEVARSGQDWAIDTLLKGPGGLTADVGGTAAADGSTVDMTAVGQLQLGLAAPVLAPRVLDGEARFDLALRGAPALSALSGTISVPDASFSAPNLRVALQNIATNVSLSNSTAQIDVDANIANGGQATVDGSVNLETLVGNIAIALQNAVLVDPNLFVAELSADLNVNGPLAGGARIEGRIDVEEVNVSVPDSGVTSVGAIPEITFLQSSAAAELTRVRAGVLPPTEPDPNARPAPAYPLSVVIDAPSQIFIRGRGLNAEVGGDLEITGTTNNIISAGSFDLIRGRIDIIGKRFDLDEGSVQFQGTLIPYILFVTTTDIPDGTASITVEGLATEPEVTFSSDPAAPEDEVMSLILFGRYVSELSAFQALQLANGVAQLTGRGGLDLVSGLRDGVGLDDLDVTTDEAGGTSVRAGKYITDDIYTDITNNTEKGTDVSVNIDLTNALTGRVSVGQEGESSLGLFFERDY